MHCPNCGTQSSSDQKFCRSCGLSLEDVSKVVASHLSTPDDDHPSAKNESSSVRRVAILLFCGIATLLTGAMILGIGKRLLQSEVMMMIGLLAVIAGALLAAYSVISPLWHRPQMPRRPAQTKVWMESDSQINTSPEGLPDPFPSVTEQTTRSLENEEVKR